MKAKNINSVLAYLNCPQLEKCALYKRKLLKRAESEQVYLNLYCTAGKENWSKCKRLKSLERYQACPDYIMPNSFYTVEEIGALIQTENGMKEPA